MELPSTSPWHERAKAVQPLPGGYDGYLDSLKEICGIVNDLHPTASALAEKLKEHFDELQTLRSARYREGFLRKVGIISLKDGRCYVSEQTSRWLKTGDVDSLIALIHSRLCFFGEMLVELEKPKRPEELRSIAETKYGLKWNTKTQVQLRRGWLQSAGLIRVTNEQELVATKGGQRLAKRLQLFTPTSQNVGPEPAGVGDSGASPQKQEATVKSSRVSEVDNLAHKVIEASTDSKNTDGFEKIVKEAFRFLGFEAIWVGGPGNTDVLLDAPLGLNGEYRVAVEAKTAGSGTLSDQNVNWMTIEDHREKHQADYAMLVGPEPSSGRLTKRAEERQVVVLSASLLAGLCRQHAEAPLGLVDYRTLFAGKCDDGTWLRRGGEVDTSDLDEAAGEGPRMRGLVAAIVRVLSDRCGEIGPLTARDLWLIMLETGGNRGGELEGGDTRLARHACPPIGPCGRR